ncbi:MAG: hypothetical protein DMG93_00680 [Acidobacteria bacterium]|nr:MAG: hypothetical protein DMG93_00680 [Acidobacteriota bacterium]
MKKIAIRVAELCFERVQYWASLRSGAVLNFQNVSPKRPMFSVVRVVIKPQQKRPWRDIMT